MKHNTYIQFSIHPSFLTKPNTDSSNPHELHFIKNIRATFSSIQADLKIAIEKKDYFKAKNPTDYSDLKVEFTLDDNSEISRSDSYRICPDLPEVISISSIKKSLNAIGITDKDKQDFILQVILQNRVGFHIGSIGALGLIPIALAKSPLHKTITIPTSSKNEKGYELSIKYNPFYDQITFSYHSPMVYGTEERLYVGDAELVVLISADFETKIVSLNGVLQPYNDILRRYGQTQEVLRYKMTFKHLYNSLHEASLLSLNPTLARQIKERTEITSDLSSSSSSTEGFTLNRFFTPLKQELSNFVHEIKSYFPAAETSNETWNTRLAPKPKAESAKGNTKQKQQNTLNELINLEDDPSKIDAFTFYPSGVISLKVTYLNEPLKRFSKKNTSTSQSSESYFNPMLKRSQRPFTAPVVDDVDTTLNYKIRY